MPDSPKVAGLEFLTRGHLDLISVDLISLFTPGLSLFFSSVVFSHSVGTYYSELLYRSSRVNISVSVVCVRIPNLFLSFSCIVVLWIHPTVNQGFLIDWRVYPSHPKEMTVEPEKRTVRWPVPRCRMPFSESPCSQIYGSAGGTRRTKLGRA
ncbi:hypothetical protein VTN96DRAFT_7103 [Rasamsonia emersonii]